MLLLLSHIFVGEARTFFSSNNERIFNGGGSHPRWWLRTPFKEITEYPNMCSYMDSSGNHIRPVAWRNNEVGVRPVITVYKDNSYVISYTIPTNEIPSFELLETEPTNNIYLTITSKSPGKYHS